MKKSSASIQALDGTAVNGSATSSQQQAPSQQQKPAPEQLQQQKIVSEQPQQQKPVLEQPQQQEESPEQQQMAQSPEAPEPRINRDDRNTISTGESQQTAQVNADTTPVVNSEIPTRQTEDGEENQSTYTPRRARRYDDPPIFFPDVDGPNTLKRLLEMLEGKLSSEEKRNLDEIMEYLTTDGGAWALGTPHLDTISRLLNDRTLPEEVPILTLKVMQAAALKEDVILLLHQDREKHHLMSYFYRIELLPEDEQTEIAALMCNLCSNGSSYDWLTYISEWEEDGRPCSNSRVTVRVAVHALLSQRPDIRDRGCALVFNLALKKELFDDIATELAMAVLQFLQSQLSEELLFQSLTALLRFMCISYNEVPALMKMLGPDTEPFRTVSARVEPLVEEIQMKLKVSR